MTNNLLIAIIQYLISTLRHKAYVFYAGVFIVGDIPIWRLLTHDLSKFNPVEFINYARYYKMEHGKANENAFVAAWMHHQKRNKHHPEYWTTVGIFDWSNRAVEMPMTYVREWVADLLGASREYTKGWDMNEWIKTNISRWDYCDEMTLAHYRKVLNQIGISVALLHPLKKLIYISEETWCTYCGGDHDLDDCDFSIEIGEQNE